MRRKTNPTGARLKAHTPSEEPEEDKTVILEPAETRLFRSPSMLEDAPPEAGSGEGSPDRDEATIEEPMPTGRGYPAAEEAEVSKAPAGEISPDEDPHFGPTPKNGWRGRRPSPNPRPTASPKVGPRVSLRPGRQVAGTRSRRLRHWTRPPRGCCKMQRVSARGWDGDMPLAPKRGGTESPWTVAPSSAEVKSLEAPKVPDPEVARAPSAIDLPSLKDATDDVVPVSLGDYEVLAAIGRGGMGQIYLARGGRSEELVALKVLGSRTEDNEEALNMLMDEARHHVSD